MTLSVHNLAHLDDEEVLERFVVRREEFDVLRGHLVDADPPRHALVIASRGMGKSLLVRRLAIAAANDPELAGRWIPLVLPEELYTVTSIGEFWLAVLRSLAGHLDDDGLREAADALLGEPDAARLESLALGRVVRAAEQRGARLLVVAENLDMLFDEQLGEDDGWALRKTLQTEPSLLLIGTATTSFAQIESHGSALYEFFRVVRLEGLDAEETRTLWNAITGASISTEQARPIQILAGGNPRMVTILGQFTSRPDLGGLLDDLERLVDEYTPYFKANIEALPSVQRKVFVTLADLWAPATAAEVATRARMDTSKVSALLGRMVKQGLVRVLDEGEGRRRYELVERLYQLFHLLRNVEQAGRVRALVDMIRHLYTPLDLHRHLMPALTARLAESPTHVLVASGLERHLDELGDEVFRTTEDWQRRKAWLETLLDKQLSTLGADTPETLDTRHEIALSLGKTGDWVGALGLFREVAADVAGVLGADHEATLRARYQVAYGLGETGDWVGALGLFREVAADRARVLGADQEVTLRARYQVAYYLGQTGDLEEALAIYRDVAARAERALGRDHHVTRYARGAVDVQERLLTGRRADLPREIREILSDQDGIPPAAAS